MATTGTRRYLVLRRITTPKVLGKAGEMAFEEGKTFPASDFPEHVDLEREIADGVLQEAPDEETH